MIKQVRTLILVAAAAGLLSLSAVAQSSAADGVDPGHPRVNEVNRREQDQQNRIANGVRNGTMSAGQAAHVERQEQHIQNQKKADMAAHNGHLTKSETRQLNREQNRTSREIYRDKHK